MSSFYASVLNQLKIPISGDPLHECGEITIDQIISNPEAALKLADEKLHVFPFKDVKICWRRLYTDAGINRAIRIITNDERPPDWLNQVVRQLDMVLIMTGAPLREQMVEDILRCLQDEYVPDKTDWTTTFNSKTLRQPDLEYPITASEMSLTEFQKHLQHPVPHVIKGAINHWPSMSHHPWNSPDYLQYRTFDGRRLVPIELGRSYTDEDWNQKIMPFSEFLDRYISNPGAGLGYLAQHDLFYQLPALRNDIYIPDFCYTVPPPSKQLNGEVVRETDEPLLNAWFGPAGTISPLHHDPYHNILCQVVGKKYVRLYAPNQAAKLYPRGTENGIEMSNNSSVPIELVEMSLGPDEDFPLFEEAEYVETILEPGDSLYIPFGWWHYVRSLSISFSVSFWWN